MKINDTDIPVLQTIITEAESQLLDTVSATIETEAYDEAAKLLELLSDIKNFRLKYFPELKK